jgi:hypothetical protein|tara:strand:- start:679 stop:1092 length:414 start_codon:yes stop_codon:yes gene_type:complete
MSAELHATMKVEQGEMIIHDRTRFKERVAQLADGEYMITILPLKAARSLKQNRFYWQLMTQMGEQCGYSKEQMHQLMKQEFLAQPMVVESPTGKVLEHPVAVSTKELDVPDFWGYTEQCLWFAQDFLQIKTAPIDKG